MKTHEEFVKTTKDTQKKLQNTCAIVFISIIPFMVLEILTHKSIFLEFSFILLLYALYNLKQILNLNKTLELIKETKIKLQKTNIQKLYPEGHHLISNPKPTILDLGGYSYVGTDNHGIKIYQNTTDIIVCGTINPYNGEIIYDEYGIPAYLINSQK